MARANGAALLLIDAQPREERRDNPGLRPLYEQACDLLLAVRRGRESLAAQATQQRNHQSQIALIDRTGGKVALRRAVTELLDGAPHCAIRIVGGAATTPRAGAFRVSRDGRTDTAIETELATALGRIAVVEGDLAEGLLEARLHGATAVSFAPPGERPRPWPRGAGLVLVLYGTQSAWVADVPNLSAGRDLAPSET